MRLLKITPEGEFSVIETTRDRFLDTCHREIGCVCIEMPGCMQLSRELQLIVDESGLLKEDPKLNPLPWFWYSAFHPDAPIVGTVLVGRLARVGKYQELDVVGLTDSDFEFLKEWENVAKATFYR